MIENDDRELYLEIDDDFKHIQFFDVDVDYPDHFGDLTNGIRVSVFDNKERVAYLECIAFHDEKIAESIYDHIHLSDSMTQDVYDAMVLLKEQSLLVPTSENQTLGELLTNYPTAIIYLHHIAVKDEYRRQGIGDWLMRNLPRILQRNYKTFPRLIITLLSPQKINWSFSPPSFSDPEEEIGENTEMYGLMKRLLEKNGYEQQGDSRYFIADGNI